MLVVCTGVTMVLRMEIKAPGFLGSVSSLTRDTPLVANQLKSGSALSGPNVERLLKEKWMRIQDVSPKKEVEDCFQR